MYSGVPSISPVAGEPVARRRALAASAMPKSATIASPSCSRMFSGLMSRWIRPCAWAWSSAAATWPADGERLVDRELPLAVEPLAQRLAPDVGHDIEEEPVGLAGVVQRQDVGVVERGGDPDLAGEAVGAEQRAELGPEHLDRHLAVVPEVVGQVDRRHAAPAELALDGVAALQRGAELFQLIGGH